MDPLVPLITGLATAAHLTVHAQHARLRELEALLQGCPEVSPAQLARTAAAQVGDGGGDDAAARVRDAAAGVVDVFVHLDVAAAEVTSCLKMARDHASFDAAALPDLSAFDVDRAHEPLLALHQQLPNVPGGIAGALVRVQLAFTCLRLLLDHHLPHTLHFLGRAGVQPQRADAVQQARTHLSRAIAVADLGTHNARVVAVYCAAQETAAIAKLLHGKE